ncbi:MAG: hypothetical protein L0207_04070 [Chlamydiae bacterium]|nr:hypothetical protein [Chlamydiota bacterium]
MITHIIPRTETIVDWAGNGATILDSVTSVTKGTARVFVDMEVGVAVFHPIVKALIPLTIAGLVFCLFESIYEIFYLYKTANFMKKNSLEKIYTRYFNLSERKIAEIQKKIIDNPALKFKDLEKKALDERYVCLEKRVAPWCAAKIKHKIDHLMILSTDSRPSVRAFAKPQIEELLNDISDQCKKKMLVHIIGLISIAIAVVSFVLVLAIVPPAGVAIFASLTGIIILFSIARMMMERGVFTQPGWTFSFNSCLPACCQAKNV